MGSSLAIIHFDEIAFLNYNWIVVPTASNSMLKASEQARKAGIPSPIIYTTTAGNPATKEGGFALNIFENATPFTETFYDMNNRNDLLDIMSKTGTNKSIFIEFSYRQLGKTDEWFRDAAARGNASQDDINRDLLNIWQVSTDKAVIPQDLLFKIKESKRDPSFVDLQDGFMVRWYVDRAIIESEEFINRPMIMGMDTSEGIGRDYNIFTIMDPRDMRVLAVSRSNDSNTMRVAQHICIILKRYPNLVFIPERNNTGIGMIDYILEFLQGENINPFTRIFNDVVQNMDDPKYKNVSIYNFKEIYGKVRSTFGFRTTGTGVTGGTRNILYKSVMMKHLEMNHSRIYDSTLITELCNLEERNGRIDHPTGCHDDGVISMLLCAFLVYHGRNLHLYNIPEGTVLQSITTTGESVKPSVMNEQLALRRRISELESLISMNPAHILKQSYLRELSTLQPLVDDSITSVKPMAISQVKYDEKQFKQSTGGSSENRMRGFLTRYNNLR